VRLTILLLPPWALEWAHHWPACAADDAGACRVLVSCFPKHMQFLPPSQLQIVMCRRWGGDPADSRLAVAEAGTALLRPRRHLVAWQDGAAAITRAPAAAAARLHWEEADSAALVPPAAAGAASPQQRSSSAAHQPVVGGGLPAAAL
jgi:hypothetical protein